MYWKPYATGSSRPAPPVHAWVLGASLIGMASALPAAAFPLDPVRIFVRGISPVAGRIEVEASIWQGGTPAALGTGRRLYRERATVETDRDGHFDLWLGEGQVLAGELRGGAFGLDKPLRVELRLGGTEKRPARAQRSVLTAIDNAYISALLDFRPPREPAQAGRSYRTAVGAFAPELVRRGMAVLYPDQRLQAEDGSFVTTAGTTTSGVQEFLDYCAQHHVDGYIVGGSVPHGQQVVYRIATPLKMRPAQGIRIDTGAISLQFLPSVGDAPGLTIDSCMMNDIRIRGLLHYMGRGPALALQPGDLLPLDRFVGPTIVDTALYVTSIACGDAASAVWFGGSINYCRFEFNEINGGRIGIGVARGIAFSNNRITCKHVHGQEEVSIRDESGAKNVWEVNLNCDAKDPRGIVTGGRESIWLASVTSRTRPSLVLQPDAQGNQFFLMGLSGGYQNHARKPTNRFYASASLPVEQLMLGYSATTPPVPPSGRTVVNRQPFPVLVMIRSPGSVTRWELSDTQGAAEAFEGPLRAGQTLYLSPGEGLRLRYHRAPPTWRWRAVQ